MVSRVQCARDDGVRRKNEMTHSLGEHICGRVRTSDEFVLYLIITYVEVMDVLINQLVFISLVLQKH